MSKTNRNPHRRDFLKSGAVALGTAGLGVFPASAFASRPNATADHCVWINLTGGPSQLDTFDPKPDAPSEIRGPFRPIQTRVPGLQLSELFPRLATVADKFSLIRSMHHDQPPVHEVGLQLLQTGRRFVDGQVWPNAAAVICRATADRANASWELLPHADVDTGINAAKGFGPAFLDVTPVTTQHQTNFVELCRTLPGKLQSGTKFITVNMFDTVFDRLTWDCHADGGSLHTRLEDYRLAELAPAFDAGFADLLISLDRQDLLARTLVVATGEFGRTPYLNGHGGRDHWARCWTALIAGGGVQGGQVVGRSDPTAGEPIDRPVTPQQLLATVYTAMGLPPSGELQSPYGPVPLVEATPVTELF